MKSKEKAIGITGKRIVYEDKMDLAAWDIRESELKGRCTAA